ncbi:DUF1080 domain-containing protein [Dokdonia sinensis]|uniref:DUF1080 domain-containing protein n=1 Tax=Dokdonia sinensis TaxID=2479847 RepID=A0A3M0GFP3_9FLAO|nr:DUF1080 domain-containing protein [Dokdonia sinensis]RMB63327.1 DUF1080 domain-containing protein [Dokdonia sinensis]
MKYSPIFTVAIAVLLTSCGAGNTNSSEPTKPEQTEVWSPKPDRVFPTGQSGAPSDAIILFNGSNLENWEHRADGRAPEWTINGDGSMTVNDRTGDIQTKEDFGSVQLHLEWKSDPNNTQTNQNRSNSGVFFQGLYEVQILNNNDNDTYVNGMVGSIYKQSIPLVNAANPTGEWNSYDIVFHAPEFDAAGKRTKAGTMTVFLNGVLVQDHYELEGSTEYIGYPKNDPHGDGPIILQDHGDKSGVGFRNIWVRKL